MNHIKRAKWMLLMLGLCPQLADAQSSPCYTITYSQCACGGYGWLNQGCNLAIGDPNITSIYVGTITYPLYGFSLGNASGGGWNAPSEFSTSTISPACWIATGLRGYYTLTCWGAYIDLGDQTCIGRHPKTIFNWPSTEPDCVGP
jgi:hypothetical protein